MLSNVGKRFEEKQYKEVKGHLEHLLEPVLVNYMGYSIPYSSTFDTLYYGRIYQLRKYAMMCKELFHFKFSRK